MQEKIPIHHLLVKKLFQIVQNRLHESFRRIPESPNHCFYRALAFAGVTCLIILARHSFLKSPFWPSVTEILHTSWENRCERTLFWL